MKRKIGEIFEYNGEWLQCVEQPEKYDKTVCAICDFHGIGNCELDECSGTCRSDKKSVIFKKLEKVGEPITVNGKNVQLLKTTIANCDNCAFYKDVNCDFTCYPRKCYGGEEGTYVEIKTKEDMEENKLNLKPFDIQRAREGKPVCTRDGRKARIICFDVKAKKPIAALITNDDTEEAHFYYDNGRSDQYQEYRYDLMMLPEKKEGWINIYNADTTFYYVDGRVFETKDEAVKEAKEEVEKEQREKNEYIDTIRVEWEE